MTRGDDVLVASALCLQADGLWRNSELSERATMKNKDNHANLASTSQNSSATFAKKCEYTVIVP